MEESLLSNISLSRTIEHGVLVSPIRGSPRQHAATPRLEVSPAPLFRVGSQSVSLLSPPQSALVVPPGMVGAASHFNEESSISAMSPEILRLTSIEGDGRYFPVVIFVVFSHSKQVSHSKQRGRGVAIFKCTEREDRKSFLEK